MKKGNAFLPGGMYFGYDGDRFVFSSWAQVWQAVTTDGHALVAYARYVLGRRPYIKPGRLQHISISFDALPPIVEVVYPRWFGWGIVIGLGIAFWAGIFFTRL